MCPTGKVGYKTKIDAEYALYLCQYAAKHFDKNHKRKEKCVYFCQMCKMFHLTSRDKY